MKIVIFFFALMTSYYLLSDTFFKLTYSIIHKQDTKIGWYLIIPIILWTIFYSL